MSSKNRVALDAMRTREGRLDSDENPSPGWEIAEAANEAVIRLESRGWPGGERVIDERGVSIAIWKSPQPLGTYWFAFDADAEPYIWEKHDRDDGQGKWCRTSWYIFSAYDHHDHLVWINSLARS